MWKKLNAKISNNGTIFHVIASGAVHTNCKQSVSARIHSHHITFSIFIAIIHITWNFHRAIWQRLCFTFSSIESKSLSDKRTEYRKKTPLSKWKQGSKSYVKQIFRIWNLNWNSEYLTYTEPSTGSRRQPHVAYAPL